MILEENFNVVIIEPDELTRFTLKKMVESFEGFVVVGDFSSAEDGIGFIDKNIVNLVIMDMNLPYLSGIEASKLIKKRYNHIKIVALTSYGSDRYIISSLLADADAYFIRDLNQFALKNVIVNVLNDICDIDLRIQYSLFNYIQTLPKEEYYLFSEKLSTCESKFINLGLKGFSEKEISKFLNLSISELFMYIHSILDKLVLFCRNSNMLAEIDEYELF